MFAVLLFRSRAKASIMRSIHTTASSKQPLSNEATSFYLRNLDRSKKRCFETISYLISCTCSLLLPIESFELAMWRLRTRYAAAFARVTQGPRKHPQCPVGTRAGYAMSQLSPRCHDNNGQPRIGTIHASPTWTSVEASSCHLGTNGCGVTYVGFPQNRW